MSFWSFLGGFAIFNAICDAFSSRSGSRPCNNAAGGSYDDPYQYDADTDYLDYDDEEDIRARIDDLRARIDDIEDASMYDHYDYGDELDDLRDELDELEDELEDDY